MRNFVLFIGFFWGIGSATADLIPSRTSTVFLCLGRVDCENGDVTNSAEQGTAAINGNFGSGAAQVQTTVSGSATSTYGALKASSSNTLNISGTPALENFFSDASFLDIMTIDFAPFTGLQGKLAITYTLDGTISPSGIDNAFSQVGIYVGPSLQQSKTDTYTSSVSGQFTHLFTFIYGQPFGLNFFLDAHSGTVIPLPLLNGWTAGFQTGSGNATADFSNTLLLSGLTVFDPTGQSIVTDAQFSSASGTQYGPSGVIPEPNLLFILIPASLLFGLIRRKPRSA